MPQISEPGVPSNVPPGIFGSIAHAGDVHHAMHHSSRESPKSGGAEGVKGATADFVRFHCPFVAPAGAIPLLRKKSIPEVATRRFPKGERKALWLRPQAQFPLRESKSSMKLPSTARKKSRWTCNLHLLFSDYLTSSQNLSMFPLTTSRLERQKSGFRTSIPTLAATSAIVPEPQERSRRQ